LGNKIGATKVHVYNARHNQLEITFTHMDAALAFSVLRVEFGLKQQKH
jgi:hypothetical protein